MIGEKAQAEQARGMSRETATTSASEESSTQATGRSFAGRVHYWWTLFVAALLLLIFGPPAIMAAYLAGRRHWVYPFARFGARNWLRLSGVRVRVRGREHVDPQQTYIFVSNHRSFLDTATLFFYGGEGRRIGILAKKELLKVPILGYGMSYVNIMAIDRSNHERAIRTVRAATERIKSGISFGVFAEGTRARPGGLLPFKKGAFYMAIDAGVPIIPVVMKNTDNLMGKGTGVARPGTIEMVYLPPVQIDWAAVEEDKDEYVKRLTRSVRAQIARELGMEEESKQ